MSEKVITTCDVKGCGATKTKKKNIQVVFLTEQTEGRSVSPYLCMCNIDICDDCENRITNERRYLTAVGAMGYNEYYFQAINQLTTEAT